LATISALRESTSRSSFTSAHPTKDKDAVMMNESAPVREGEADLGLVEDMVFVDGDVHMTLEASRLALESVENGGTFRQWRTPYLVGNNRLICLAQAASAAPGYTT
jgi:hypothetical protein